MFFGALLVQRAVTQHGLRRREYIDGENSDQSRADRGQVFQFIQSISAVCPEGRVRFASRRVRNKVFSVERQLSVSPLSEALAIADRSMITNWSESSSRLISGALFDTSRDGEADVDRRVADEPVRSRWLSAGRLVDGGWRLLSAFELLRAR